MDLKEKVKLLPTTSGVYLMKNKSGKVIYVGKAISIRKRVQSYFTSKKTMTKTDLLVADIVDIDFIETASEAGALILEASLIKKYDPRYNVMLRDDKSYPFIVITNEEFPRIYIDRPNKRQKGYLYFGPYINPRLIKEAMHIIRKIFHFRTCYPLPNKECLDFHIGLCDAPCIGNISKTQYKHNVKNVKWILEGKKDLLYRGLRKDMERSAQEKNYEQAAKVRDQLQAIGALYSGTQDINYYKEAEQLQRVLNLDRIPERIEAFDISNTFGNQSVGSMVSFFHGKPDKQNYRRFKIKDVQGIDDFSMIGEVVRRRYKRLKNERKIFPDLILIDGGKGQLSSAVAELKSLEVEIPIISLAKREEEIFLPGKRNAIRLAKTSLGLQLLQQLRDEAHRFALNYHRKLRDKNVYTKK